jgi:hypothetical protein
MVNTPTRWPTPTVQDKEQSGGVGCILKKNRGLSLTIAARLFPTPAARDYRHPNAMAYALRGGGKKGEQLPNVIGGALNPPWVEWLMGWPIGWTDLNALGMDRFRRWSDSHGRS